MIETDPIMEALSLAATYSGNPAHVKVIADANDSLNALVARLEAAIAASKNIIRACESELDADALRGVVLTNARDISAWEQQ